MTRMVLVWGLWFTLFGGTVYAEAGVLGWPVISQVTAIGKCIVEDAGKLGLIVVNHATQAAVEVLTTVRDCVDFIVREATPLPDAEPHV